MTQLYIANVSRKNHIVCFRLDFNADGELKDANRRFELPRQQEIKAGRQEPVGGDLHPTQITDIVDQLAHYGLIGVVDVPRIARGKVHELVYNIGQPVPRAIMVRVRDSNSGVLVQKGIELRKNAAVATNELVQQTVAQQFAEAGINAVPADRTRVAFEQIDQSEAGERRIEEGYEVVPVGATGTARGTPPPGKPPKKRSRGK